MLKDLFDKYDCDKSSKHQYHLVYEPYFKPRRTDPINLLEVGTYLGASTSALHEYFPKANIYTIDIFDRTDPKTLKILKEERVHWLKSDSMDVSLPSKVRTEWGDVKFDFIIDDGAHWPEANRLTFQNLMRFLKEDGTYFIEDVWPMDKMSQSALSNPWLKKHPDRYDMLQHIRLMDTLDKYETEIYDQREKTKEGDTYIIAVTK